MATFESSLKSCLIYIFAIDDAQHQDCLKIGMTTLNSEAQDIPAANSTVLNEAAHARIREYTRTAGISYRLLHTELAMFIKDKQVCAFDDKQVHWVLERSGVKRKAFAGATEWYCCDLETAKRAIETVKNGRESLPPGAMTGESEPLVLRPEQEEAVQRTHRQFRRGKRMLWNAKMRFGKTLCALRVAREMEMRRTLIITHRPVVDAGWFDEFKKVFYDRPDYHYASHDWGEGFAALERMAARGDKYVCFASMQDLRGAQQVGGSFDKHHELFATHWDFLIIDEAHEGTQTELGQAVLKQLTGKNTRVLRLSGTPFNLLDEHRPEEVFTWDYIMEQRAKLEWDTTRLGDTNPYASLPAMHIYTYDLGSLLSEYGDEERAFNFREFFRVRADGVFAHEADVDRFLDLLCSDEEGSLYPYANETFRGIFRHTLWILPGVQAARAMSLKLKAHPVFGQFRVVNVAGDGDQEEESRNALQMVNGAIGPEPDTTRTITLSCGRLTTGVSVPAWTGVFLMAGAYSTSAAGYMQTIFRVQTPHTRGGQMKTDCYAFDFAPDRTLRVLAETARLAARAQGQEREDRQMLGDFLNFCPIIAVEGGRMQPYDVHAMLVHLKRAHIERVVQEGFWDEALYSGELLRLTAVELREFEELRAIIGKTQAMPRPGDIDINRQGLTHEQRAELGELEGRRKQTLSPQEQQRLAELQAMSKARSGAISILRGISIRMPLMLYGAEMANEDTELTLENFTNLVDDSSWEEFMPRGVTKEVFRRFQRYYDPDVFRGAGQRIRAMVRAADQCSIEERIERIAALFVTFRNPDKETVLTPWRVVNMHLGESLGGWCFYDAGYHHPLDAPRHVACVGITEEVFSPQSRILEINSKSGLYPLYATYSIYRARRAKAENKYGEVPRALALQLWDTTLEQNILALCMTPMARSITRRTLAGFRDTTVHAECYPKLIPSLTGNLPRVARTLRDGKRFWHISSEQKMDINAIIGNPPYQVMVEGNGRAKPVYHLFMELAFQLAPRSTLITPARYLFNAGFTPPEWNAKVLGDPHFRIVWYRATSTEVFPFVDIKGGVAVMYYDRGQHFGAIGVFKARPELDSIAQKVASCGGLPLTDIIYAESSYRFNTSCAEVRQLVKERLNGDRKIISNVFDKLPDLFTEARRDDAVKVYGLLKSRRCVRYVSRDLLEEHPNMEKYKVIVPKSNGSGAIGEILSSPFIGEPSSATTQTFLTIGAFGTREEAEACLKYVKSKFARTMLGILKVTQNNPKDTWRYIPLQDFTAGSDIDWSQPVASIDRQLYQKYGLSEGEISFIERMVKPMS